MVESIVYDMNKVKAKPINQCLGTVLFVSYIAVCVNHLIEQARVCFFTQNR